jgi:hypothetical protein
MSHFCPAAATTEISFDPSAVSTDQLGANGSRGWICRKCSQSQYDYPARVYVNQPKSPADQGFVSALSARTDISPYKSPVGHICPFMGHLCLIDSESASDQFHT